MTWQHRRRGCAAALSDRIFFVLPPAEFGTRQREPHAGSVATALLGQQPRRPTERAATAEIGQCLALSFGFFFTFCAWHSAQNLQSSLPLHRGVKGTTALAIVYCLLGPGNFSAPAVVQRVGLKRTIILAMGMYGSFIAANIFPRWYTIYPAAVAVGLACPPLFVAQNTFLTALAIAYAQKKKLPEKTARVGMFQGMFNAIFMTTQLFGNSFYGLVFRHFGGGSTVIKGLFTFYLCLVVVGMLLIAAALDDQLPPACESEEDVKSQPLQPPVKRVTTTAVLFAPKMLWLLPLQGAGGFMSSFITADFTARIVKVSLGEANLGFVMAVCGTRCRRRFRLPFAFDTFIHAGEWRGWRCWQCCLRAPVGCWWWHEPHVDICDWTLDNGWCWSPVVHIQAHAQQCSLDPSTCSSRIHRFKWGDDSMHAICASLGKLDWANCLCFCVLQHDGWLFLRLCILPCRPAADANNAGCSHTSPNCGGSRICGLCLHLLETIYGACCEFSSTVKRSLYTLLTIAPINFTRAIITFCLAGWVATAKFSMHTLLQKSSMDLPFFKRVRWTFIESHGVSSVSNWKSLPW